MRTPRVGRGDGWWGRASRASIELGGEGRGSGSVVGGRGSGVQERDPVGAGHRWDGARHHEEP